MKQLADLRRLAEVQHVFRAANVRCPRFPFGTRGMELQTGRVMNDAVAVFRHPADIVAIQPQIRLTDVPFEHNGTGQTAVERFFPAGEEMLDPLPGRHFPGVTDQYGDRPAGLQQITEQIISEQTGGTGQQSMLHVLMNHVGSDGGNSCKDWPVPAIGHYLTARSGRGISCPKP